MVVVGFDLPRRVLRLGLLRLGLEFLYRVVLGSIFGCLGHIGFCRFLSCSFWFFLWGLEAVAACAYSAADHPVFVVFFSESES